MTPYRIFLALAGLSLCPSVFAADRPKFPAGKHVLSCAPRTLTGKHTLEIKEPFELQPGQDAAPREA